MMRKSLIQKLSAAMACSLLLSALTLAPVYAAESEEETPVVAFEYCGIDFVPDKKGPDGYPYRCLVNDLFYIEYPGTWSFGTNSLCPIVFFNHSEVTKTVHDFETFQDAALIGTADQIDQYIQNGGLAQYLQQVLDISDLSEYTFYTQTREDSLLIYSLLKDGNTTASIVVWTAFGQVSIRDERSDISMDPKRDYGKIMVMPVWDTEDFSSVEAIQAYVDSGELNSRLALDTSLLAWTTKPYHTDHHTYLLCEGSCEFLNVSVYIPVTPAGSKKWMVCFEAFIESEIPCNAYQIREDIIQTFKILK